jgi:hypothetical protein
LSEIVRATTENKVHEEKIQRLESQLKGRKFKFGTIGFLIGYGVCTGANFIGDVFDTMNKKW